MPNKALEAFEDVNIERQETKVSKCTRLVLQLEVADPAKYRPTPIR